MIPIIKQSTQILNILRLDKPSESHIKDYLEKCYSIVDVDYVEWSLPSHILIEKLYEIRRD
jgi:hypothetical protein